MWVENLGTGKKSYETDINHLIFLRMVNVYAKKCSTFAEHLVKSSLGMLSVRVRAIIIRIQTKILKKYIFKN
jgi:hypothetical protein